MTWRGSCSGVSHVPATLVLLEDEVMCWVGEVSRQGE